MYKYEYETVSCYFESFGFGVGHLYKTDDFRSIIDKRAEAGWRYVGFIPTAQRATGRIEEIDLIFEKEV